MKEQTTQIKFKHCYSHTKNINILDNAEKTKFKTKKFATLIEIYGEENAYKYIKDNKQANKLVDKIHDTLIYKVLAINKY